VNDIKYLSGIPNDARIGKDRVHKLITQSWDEFLNTNVNATREQVLEHMRELDEEYGRYFVPPLKKGAR
jgi:ubiquinone biosynthesis protein Coq4